MAKFSQICEEILNESVIVIDEQAYVIDCDKILCEAEFLKKIKSLAIGTGDPAYDEFTAFMKKNQENLPKDKKAFINELQIIISKIKSSKLKKLALQQLGLIAIDPSGKRVASMDKVHVKASHMMPIHVSTAKDK